LGIFVFTFINLGDHRIMNTTQIDLSGFYGSENLIRWSPITRSVLSDGAHYLAETAQAYWLFDAIDSHLTTRGVTDETEFTVATLRRLSDTGTDAELTLDDGNGNIYVKQYIQFTDFPLAEIKLYAVFNGNAWTHMLPSEY
jgi:hypothetical protein